MLESVIWIVCDILCEPTGEGWSDELKLQSIDEDVDEDDLDEDGKERDEWESMKQYFEVEEK